MLPGIIPSPVLNTPAFLTVLLWAGVALLFKDEALEALRGGVTS